MIGAAVSIGTAWAGRDIIIGSALLKQPRWVQALTLVAALAGIAGSIAGVIALWPIFFPTPSPPPPPPPPPTQYVYFEPFPTGMVLKRSPHAHNITVTMFSTVKISGQHAMLTLGDVDFVGDMCGPMESGGGFEGSLLGFSSRLFSEQMDGFDKYATKHPDVLVVSTNFNVAIGELTTKHRTVAVWLKVDFENDEANKTSRFFHLDPIGQRASLIAPSEFERNKQALDRLEKLVKTGSVVDQPFLCHATTNEFP
jgi:hypothetical protein